VTATFFMPFTLPRQSEAVSDCTKLFFETDCIERNDEALRSRRGRLGFRCADVASSCRAPLDRAMIDKRPFGGTCALPAVIRRKCCWAPLPRSTWYGCAGKGWLPPVCASTGRADGFQTYVTDPYPAKLLGPVARRHHPFKRAHGSWGPRASKLATPFSKAATWHS